VTQCARRSCPAPPHAASDATSIAPGDGDDIMAALYTGLARVMHETPSRDRGDGRATGQPQGLGPEAYLFSTSQGELVLSLSKEHPRTPGRTARSAVAAGGSCIMRARSGDGVIEVNSR